MLTPSPQPPAAAGSGRLMGYRRANGRVGIRNHVLVLGINGLAVRVAERIAAAVCGCICVATTAGRGQVEPDLTCQIDQLASLQLANPTAATDSTGGASNSWGLTRSYGLYTRGTYGERFGQSVGKESQRSNLVGNSPSVGYASLQRPSSVRELNAEPAFWAPAWAS